MRDVRAYRPIPFWSWNDKLEEKRLIEQVHWMKENGIGGFFMHARSGLQTEYLSEEWMQCIEACAEEAKQFGMKAWIYDENGWPSGFAGGKLLEDERNCDKYIEMSEGGFDEGATVSYLLTEEELVRVFAQNVQNGVYLNLYIYTSVSTADILNPAVVDKFLGLTHEAYKTHFGKTFAEKIEGFFTDEPQYQRWNTPYTDMLAQYWQEKFGEDILDGLGLLFVEKKGYRSFRYRYWKAMQELMLDGFAKRVYNWCDNNGVKLTGHYVEETSLGYQMMCCGGVMPFYEYEHIPGIDWLGKSTASALSAKQVGSVAAQLGKKQVLTETFGCCGWDVLPSELRRIVGVQYANGVNMMCHHLVPYSERGTRKYDYPAHYSEINPWVKENFKEFNDYFTELGYLLGEGEQSINVAMLHPIRSAYFDYKREMESVGFGVSELDSHLQKALHILASHGIEYHFLDETLLAKYGFVEESRIGCGKCAYDYLVLPSMITMDKTTEKLVREYVEQGGKVLLLGTKPIYLEAEEYAYTYLESNVSLEEMMQAQKYQISNYDTEIYSTYRMFEEEEYLYVTNSSDSKSSTQIFCFGKKSFEVTLKPGEDKLLCLSEEAAVEDTALTPYELCFTQAEVSVKENYLPVDTVRYSTDGENYSELWPCPALFEKLIREQYQGPLFLQYEFEVAELPSQIFVRGEKSNDVAAWLNGKELTETVSAGEDDINLYDITFLVQKGTNTYTSQIDWYQNKMVYFALFGENVTESLKNCIVYDTELQPIELVGTFGVYPQDAYQPDEDERFVRGENFYIGALPEVIVSEPVTEGFPFLAGEMALRQKVTFDTSDILLQIAGEYQMAFVTVNGRQDGKLLFDKELDISDVAKAGENEIEVRFILGNRNRMGPHHVVRDKDAEIDPNCFQLLGTWEENQCQWYHSFFDIKKFYN